jgi:hypothetical protein
MNIFGFNITKGTQVKDFIPYDPKNALILSFSGFGCTPDFSNINTPPGQAYAYQCVRPIRMTINRRAQSFMNGKVWVLDKKGNEVKSAEAVLVRTLLENPNPLQTWADFYLQQKIYKYVFGYCPVYALRPAGMSEPAALYNILPLIFKPILTEKLYQQTKYKDIVCGYIISYNGIESNLSTDDVYISKDISQNLEVGKILPDSRLTNLQYEAAISNAIGEAKYITVSRRGALGILSDETKENSTSIPLTPDERRRIQEEYRKYGISTTQNQIIITNASLKWQQIGISIRELMLLELGDDANMKVADMYDYPYELFGNTKGVTFANKSEAKKQYYQDTVIPEANTDSQGLTKFLKLENSHIDIDFSHIPVLQEDRKRSAETLDITTKALSTALRDNTITIDEYRKELSKIIDIDPNQIPEQNEQNTTETDGQQATQE